MPCVICWSKSSATSASRSPTRPVAEPESNEQPGFDPQRLPRPEETQPLRIMWEYVAVLSAVHLVALYAFLPWTFTYLFTWSGLVLAILGHLLLREDRDFHTIQTVEAAFKQYTLLRDTPEALHVLVAAARYLALGPIDRVVGYQVLQQVTESAAKPLPLV